MRILVKWFSHADLPDDDFSDDPVYVTIPAYNTLFKIPTFVTIYEDNVDENGKVFAIVAEILDVPEHISCFQTSPGTMPCYGRRGATAITITDRKLLGANKYIASSRE